MYNCIWSMKKVLIVFNHPAPYKVRLFNELAKSFDLHVIFERKTASDRQKGFYYEKQYQFNSHKIHGLSIGKENFISRGVIRELKNNKYDLIIMNGYSTLCEMKTISYLKRKNIPYVFYINGGLTNENESKLKHKIKTHFIGGAKAYLSPDEISNKYLTYYGADKNKIFNYPYSTIFENEILASETNKKQLRKDLNINYEKLFVSSGQLIKRKNYMFLVKEWQNMPENYGFFIFGEGKQRKQIEKLIKTNNIKNVELKGFTPRKEMFQYFKAADAFIFGSKEDIYGHVINEALSQGLPVISTKNVNSAIHLIKNNFNGFLFDELNSQEMIEAISKLDKENYFKNCIMTAKENTIEKMAQTHIGIFERILSR